MKQMNCNNHTVIVPISFMGQHASFFVTFLVVTFCEVQLRSEQRIYFSVRYS